MMSLLLPVLAAISPLLAVDPAAHAVEFTAIATGLATNAPVEFVFAGAKSDRDYEAMFLLEVGPAEFKAALAAAGIPAGKSVGEAECRFYPVGVRLDLEPALATFVRDARTSAPLPAVIYPGGCPPPPGDSSAMVFATYSAGASPLAFDEALDQSAAYGRIQPVKALKAGEKVRFRLSWDGQVGYKAVVFRVEAGKVSENFAALKAQAATTVLDVLPAFDGALTVREAMAAAAALAALDSPRLKVGGFKPGEFFYRAFLPDQRWLDRTARLAQPIEVRLRAEGGEEFTFIEEDWSGEGADPILKPRSVGLEDVKAAKADTVFYYVAADERLARLYELKCRLGPKFVNHYVFVAP